MSLTFDFKGCLFDLDGTLVDSNAAVNRAWTALAERHALDCDYVLGLIHGRPASESIKELLISQEETVIDKEIAWLKDFETKDTQGVVAIDGAIQFLTTLNELNIPWGIVTSGVYSVATARIKAGKIPKPKILITADQIVHGKPDPEPYLLGAKEIAVSAEQCLVFEDAPAGFCSGLSAKSQVIGILSHGQPDTNFDIDYIKSYDQVKVIACNGNYQLIISN